MLPTSPQILKNASSTCVQNQLLFDLEASLNAKNPFRFSQL